MVVEADAFADGHDEIRVVLRWCEATTVVTTARGTRSRWSRSATTAGVPRSR